MPTPPRVPAYLIFDMSRAEPRKTEPETAMTTSLESPDAPSLWRIYVPERRRAPTALLTVGLGLLTASSMAVAFARAEASQSMIMLAAVASAVCGAVCAATSTYFAIALCADAQDYDSALLNLDEASAGSLPFAGVHGGHHALQERIVTRGSHAALATAFHFALGAAAPIIAIGSVDREAAVSLLTTLCLGLLSVLGAFSAHMNGTGIWRGASRFVMLGSIALALTAAAGRGFRLPT